MEADKEFLVEYVQVFDRYRGIEMLEACEFLDKDIVDSNKHCA